MRYLKIPLFASLLLAAVPAHAEPISALVTYISTTLLITEAAVYFYAAVIAASVFGAADARRKARNAESDSKRAHNAGLEDRTVTVLRAAPPWQVVYGDCVVGGTILDSFATDKAAFDANGLAITKADGWRHLVIALAAHECNAITDVFLDGVSVGTLDASGWATNSDTILSTEWHAAEAVSAGATPGLIKVFAYKSSATLPADNPGAVTFTFNSNSSSAFANSWLQVPPTVPSGQTLWCVVATAVGAGLVATDTIAANEWASPVATLAAGADGTAGTYTETVQVYVRTATNSAPALPTGNIVYSVSSKTFTGTIGNGWTVAVPVAGGSFLWVTRATASATNTLSLNTAKASTRQVFFTGSTTLAETPVAILSAYSGGFWTINAGQSTANDNLVTQTVTISGNTLTGPAGIEVFVDYVVQQGGSILRVGKNLGTDTQVTDAFLNATDPIRYTSAHRLRGICYVSVTLDLEDQRFQGGPPALTFRVEGRKVLDTRTSVTAFSRNPALIIRDFLTSPWGVEVLATEVNTAYTNAAASVCDVPITLVTGAVSETNMATYTCDGAFSTDANPTTVLNDLLGTMAGRAVYAGEWQVSAGTWTASIMSLGDDDLAGQIDIAQADVGLDDLFNGMRGQYIPQGRGTPEDFEPYIGPAFLTADGKNLWQNQDLPYTNHKARARNLCRIQTEHARSAQVISYPAKLKAWPLQVGDRVSVTSSLYAITAKTYMVTDWQFSITGVVGLVLQEDDSSVWDMADATVSDPTPNIDVVNPWAIPLLQNVAAVSGQVNMLTTADGTVIPRVRVTWALPLVANIVAGGRVEVRWKYSGDLIWTTLSIPASETTLFITDVKEGKTILIDAKLVNNELGAGRSVFLSHAVTGKATPPGNVAGLAQSTTASGLRVTWTDNTEADYDSTALSYGVAFAGSTFLWRGPASEATVSLPSNGSYTIWAVHYNTSGLVSATPASVTVAYTVPTAGQLLTLVTTGFAFIYADSLATTSASPTLTIDAVLQNISGTATFVATAFDSTNTSLGTITLGGSGNSNRTLTSTQFNSLGATTTKYVKIVVTLGSLTDRFTVYRGDNGSSAINLRLDNESHTVPTAADGTGGVFTGAVSTVRVYEGITDVTSLWTLTSAVSSCAGTFNGVSMPNTVSGAATPSIAVASMSADAATVTITATRSGYPTQTSVMSLAKSKGGTAGSTGAAGASSALSKSAFSVPTAADGTGGVFTGCTTTMSVLLGGVDDSANWTYAATQSGGLTITEASTSRTQTVTAMSVDIASITITASKATYTNQVATFSVIKAKAGATGTTGSTTALVYAYKRAASAPVDNPGAVTYDFTTNTITVPASLANSWNKTIPAGTNPLYVTVATAASNTSTDTIGAGEWSSPVLLVQDGAGGSSGLNVATVDLFSRTATNSAPAQPTGSITYTFSSGGVSGTPGGTWQVGIPSSGGGYLWAVRATASNTTPTDSIAAGEWSTAVLVAQDGSTGTTGSTTALVYAYKRAASAPVDNPGAVTYDFTTNTITVPASLANSWNKTIPAGTNPLYVTVATAASNTSTDTIGAGEWSSPVLLVQDGAAGANGLNVATVELFVRSATSSAPAQPTGSVDYTFSTGAIAGTPGNGWQAGVPSSGGGYLWVIRATAASTATFDSIAPGEWSTASLMAQDGATGTTGTSTVGYTVYQRATAAPATPTTGTGSWNFTTATGTPPSGWSNTLAAGNGPGWSTSTVLTGISGSVAAGAWSTPVLMAARPPIRGLGAQFGMRVATWDTVANQLANRVIDNIINNTTTSTALATTTHLVVGDEVTHGNSSPWIETQGTYNAATAYRVGDLTIYTSGTTGAYRCILASTGNLPTNTTYWVPYVAVVTGGSAWATATIYAADSTVTGLNTSAVSTIWISRYLHTSQGTFATERDGGGFTEQRYWDGSAWARIGISIDGNLLVKGSIAGDKLSVASLSAISADLGTMTAGNIDTVGYVRVGGYTSTSVTTSTGTTTQNVAVVANYSSSAAVGVYALAGTGTQKALVGYKTGASGEAVNIGGPTAAVLYSTTPDSTAVDITSALGNTSAGSTGMRITTRGGGGTALSLIGANDVGGFAGDAYALRLNGKTETNALITSTLAGAASLVLSPNSSVPSAVNGGVLAHATYGLLVSTASTWFQSVGVVAAGTAPASIGSGTGVATPSMTDKPGASSTGRWMAIIIDGAQFDFLVYPR